ncbi:MAG: hypothetical protein IJB97_00940 [Clostridia bacterium]|nr:hypothetical protein [Clostridia bacterium]
MECEKLLSAVFKNPNDWKCRSSSDFIETVSTEGLGNGRTAATYLKSTYCYDTWERA